LITSCLWLYPDQRLPSGRSRRIALSLFGAGLAYGLVVFVPWAAAALAPQVRVDASGTPAGLTHGATGLIWQVAVVGIIGLLLCWAAWLAVQVPRYRRSSGERRMQLKWLYGGGVVFVVSLAVTVTQTGSTTRTWGIITAVAAVGLGAMPVALGIGILKFRLHDIDRIISRTQPGLRADAHLDLASWPSDVSTAAAHRNVMKSVPGVGSQPERVGILHSEVRVSS
jgi:hypothetical protein